MRMPIKDYEDRYCVTTGGQVWSVYKQDWMKPSVTEKGYLTVELRKFGKRYKARIHRLVAEAFIPNPDNLPEINHKDGNKQNNDVSNLEWCTHSENLKHAYETGLEKIVSGDNHHRSKLTKEQVDYIKRVYEKRDPIFGGTALAKRFNVSLSTVMKKIGGCSS